MNDIVLTTQPWRRPREALKRLFWNAASMCSLSGLYAGRICPTWLRYTRLEMPLPGLPKAFEGATLVHISDLHSSPIVLERYLRECVEHVNDLSPDFVVLTGDFITGGTAYAKRVARLLNDLKANVARVACLGNHDYGIYHPRGSGYMRQLPGYMSRRMFESGIHVLRNQHAIFHREGEAIQFVGAEDLWSPHYNPSEAFAEARRDLPTICLSHNPDTAAAMIRHGAHWVLSGHTHGSWPGENPVRDAVFPIKHKRFVGGHYRVADGHLYVNRGLSYARRTNVNRRPEITVFRMSRASADV